MFGTDQGIPIVGPILNKIIGSRNDRFVKRYTSRVQQINAFEPQMRVLTDAQLREKIDELRARHAEGTKGDDLMVEAFAVAREGMDRNVGIRNIFNPEHGFDASRLPDNARAIYEQISSEIEGVDPSEPVGELRGNTEPIPAWVTVDIPPELYDAVRELYPESRPPFRARPFDVQLIGAMVLYQGKISEMKTGEGKTIVAPLAAYLAAVTGEKVHVVTVNDYLVQRDRDWTFPFFRGMGLTVGAIHPQHTQPESVKRDMYTCDIVYGTTSEFGFDYLRDNMKRTVDQQVQRRRDFAIVDEVDSVLIDEARTPLIISGQAHDVRPRYELADQIAGHLKQKQAPWQEQEDKVQASLERIKGLEGDIRQARDQSSVPELKKQLEAEKGKLPDLERARDEHVQYYEVQMDRRQVHLTHDGIAEAQRAAGVGSFYVGENIDIPHLLENALRGHVIYVKDKDYVIMNVPDAMSGRPEPSIVIVDTFTGRPMIGRQWSDGLHQAIECKEKVRIKEETQTVASVTVQNFFKMYKRLAGMTGTADTEAQEFHDIYRLDVVSIPTNKPVARDDFDDLMFLRAKDKWSTIVDEIKAFHDVGRPILVGTTSVEISEMLSGMLTKTHGIKHSVLNAKQHEREAGIVEDAGQLGAVMIATNMAGRGTDIKLGRCDRESLIEHWLKRGVAARGINADMSVDELRENVYRKVAVSELGMKKRDAESAPFEEIEMALLRHWAEQYTWLNEKQIQSFDAESLREELDANDRCLLHRIRWFENVEDLGGLHVIGTERHESRRIDNQLRGRSGRQGDQGSSRFFVSLEDDLMKMFAGETTMRVLARMGMKEGDAIEHPMLSKSVERAQRKVEERNFQIRKNILEYDEVMEHQRQRFYGLRQRVLEGRRVKPLIMEYIGDGVNDAVGEYLSPTYAAECAVEHAREVLDADVAVDRLKNRDADEMDLRIRDDAKAEGRSMIEVTLGEYMSAEESEVVVEFDSAGLTNWAKTRFDVDLHVADLQEGDHAAREKIRDDLIAAMERKVDSADLGRLAVFCAPLHGAERLAKWAESKFGVRLEPQRIQDALDNDEESPADLILDEVTAAYSQRETEYPVDFAMQMTALTMRQSPEAAMEQLTQWVRNRLDTDLEQDEIRKLGPQGARDKLLELAREADLQARCEKKMEEAASKAYPDELNEHLKAEFEMESPDWFEWLDEGDRTDAVAGLVESRARPEFAQLERAMLVETLDSSWKDHLYSMDQLRDGIGFQAIAQQDPRIAYKKQGAERFDAMLEHVRDRVTDGVFKARLTVPNPPAPRPAPPPAGAAPAGAFGSTISGPGLGGPPPAQPPKPQNQDGPAAV